MRVIPEALAAHLAGEATTLATCWIMRRRDGAVLGFTDHDRQLLVDGVPCVAATGLDASAVTAGADMAAGNEEVAGVIDSGAVTEDDILAGRYDGAAVAVWQVNWADPAAVMLLRQGTIGAVTRQGQGFRAEIRGLAARLDEPAGRLYGRRCDAELGDSRCGVALAAPVYQGTGTIAGGDGRSRLLVSGLDAFAAGWFAGGTLAVGGRALRVDTHTVGSEGAALGLWRQSAEPIATGSAVTVTAGCDKRLETCRERFANAVNFRGFPHIPGNDFAFSYARRDGDNDGGLLFG